MRHLKVRADLILILELQSSLSLKKNLQSRSKQSGSNIKNIKMLLLINFLLTTLGNELASLSCD